MSPAATSDFVRRSGQGIVLGPTDRSRSFQQARRHSVLVRTLRVALPLASIGLAGAYAVAVVTSAGWVTQPVAQPLSRIVPELITMDNPHYKGFNKDGGTYDVTSVHARQDLSRDGFLLLETITGVMFEKDQSTTTMTATSGAFDSKGNILELSQRIDVKASSGLTARLTQATVDVKAAVVRSIEPVEVRLPSGTVTGNTMELRQKARAVTFVDAVHAHLVPPEPTAATAPHPVEPKGAQTPPQQPLFASSGGPIDVTSTRLDIDDMGHTAIFTVGVRAVQGDAALETPELDIIYEPKAPATGQVAPAAPSADAQNAVLRHMTAKGPVLMVRTNGDEAHADMLDHEAASKVTTLTGNVILTQVPDRRLTGDRAELNGETNAMLMTGSVVLLQGRNELHGRRLLQDQRTGKAQLTAPADGGVPAGRISARFYQGDPKALGQVETAGKAKAQPVAPPAGDVQNFKTDPSQPIDVEADRLDVDDHIKKAVFTGSVKAQQGVFVVHGDELTAKYSGAAGLASGTAPAPAVGGPPGQGGAQLTHIQVLHHVIITSKVGQMATGEAAEFDVKGNKAVLTGDVHLSQEKNITNGTRLVIDLNTGEYTLDAAPVTVVTKGGTATASTGTRPSGTFYPGQHQQAGAAAATVVPPPAAAPGTPTASSWEARADPAAPVPKK